MSDAKEKHALAIHAEIMLSGTDGAIAIGCILFMLFGMTKYKIVLMICRDAGASGGMFFNHPCLNGLSVGRKIGKKQEKILAT